MSRPTGIGIRHQGPGIRRKIEHRITIGSPALLKEDDVEPGSGGTAIHRMNPDGLAGSRGRPLRIALDNAVDGLIQDIDEFGLRWVIRIQTINLCLTILGPGSRR